MRKAKTRLLILPEVLRSIFPMPFLDQESGNPGPGPNNFEGIGEKGLEWLKTAAYESGLRVATEVANTRHVELCLEHGIDILWLGARTTVNPFYVQEIAESLKGTGVVVMVKNPVVPDLNLWIGAIERVRQTGIEEIIAIHRGISSFRQQTVSQPASMGNTD